MMHAMGISGIRGSRRAGAVILAAMSLAGTGSAFPVRAQSWSAPVTLGPATNPIAHLAMNESGAAEIVFGHTPNSTMIGSVALAQISAGQNWSPAVMGFSQYDAINPAIAISPSGRSFLMFDGSQIDNYNSVVESCEQAGFGQDFACGFAGTNTSIGQQTQIAFIEPASVEQAIYLANFGCSLVVGNSLSGWETTLATSADCAKSFALSASAPGAAAAMFLKKSGVLDAAVRSPTGAWSLPQTIAPKGLIPVANIAAATSPSGESRLAWTVGKPGSHAVQVWSLDIDTNGVNGTAAAVTSSACNTGVSISTQPSGGFVLFYALPGSKKGTCEIVTARAPAGGPVGSATAMTSGAHAASVTAVETAGGNAVAVYRDGAKASLMAVWSASGITASPVSLGALATPVLAAGGGYVNAAWCTSSCAASTLELP